MVFALAGDSTITSFTRWTPCCEPLLCNSMPNGTHFYLGMCQYMNRYRSEILTSRMPNLHETVPETDKMINLGPRNEGKFCEMLPSVGSRAVDRAWYR